MLYLSLIVSAGVLLLANGMYRWGGLAAATGLMVMIGGIVLMMAGCLLPAVVIQVVLLMAVAGICGGAGARPSSYLKASITTTCGIYLVLAVLVIWPAKTRVDGLRKTFPVASMAERMPAPKTELTAIGEAALERLASFENVVEGNQQRASFWGGGREAALRHLHTDTTAFFVNSPGFGVMRVPRMTLESIDRVPDDPGLIRQPGERETSTGGSGDGPLVGSDDRGLDLHRQSLEDFLNPRSFGYLRDRSHSVGFLSHRFSEAPPAPKSYRLQTLDLVGLVKHEQPVAYVSEHLPRMDELKDAPTRNLDDFEAEALDALNKGEDLVARESAGRLRMLGAIRAVRQCTTCHGCERGVLLGAFSYSLKRGE